MADGEDRTALPPRELTNLKLPDFDWKAHNLQSPWEIFKARITFILEGMEYQRRSGTFTSPSNVAKKAGSDGETASVCK